MPADAPPSSFPKALFQGDVLTVTFSSRDLWVCRVTLDEWEQTGSERNWSLLCPSDSYTAAERWVTVYMCRGKEEEGGRVAYFFFVCVCVCFHTCMHVWMCADYTFRAVKSVPLQIQMLFLFFKLFLATHYSATLNDSMLQNVRTMLHRIIRSGFSFPENQVFWAPWDWDCPITDRLFIICYLEMS